jgi:hypothetical protein
LNSQSSSSQPFPFLRIALCAAALIGLAGCPQGADLENPEDYTIPVAAGGTGSGGSSGGSSGLPPLVVPDCDYKTALTKSCAISVCHSARAPFAGLNLTPDDLLATRLKDVVATNGDLDCDPGEQYLLCEMLPQECSAFATAKLVDSGNPDASFILTKMSESGCGNKMPMPPGDAASAGWNADRAACIDKMVRAIAAL